MIFIDTNYFLRYLRSDIPEQARTAKKLFSSAAEGRKKIFTSLVVFFEIFWVAIRFYKYDKDKVIKFLSRILAMDFLVLPEKEILSETLVIYEKTSLEFEDCYNVVFAKKNKAEEFRTFDRKLENFYKK